MFAFTVKASPLGVVLCQEVAILHERSRPALPRWPRPPGKVGEAQAARGSLTEGIGN